METLRLVLDLTALFLVIFVLPIVAGMITA